MFEQQQQTTVETLLHANKRFRALYERHSKLKKDLLEAEAGAAAHIDPRVARLKREKLFAKDEMTAIIAAYESET